MTGPVPNPLASASDRVIAIGVDSTTAVQEAQLVAVHALCAAVERHLVSADPTADATGVPVSAPAGPGVDTGAPPVIDLRESHRDAHRGIRVGRR
jgi:hypothetical protein